ncbi:MAG: heavy metal translocating P-type ATPase [Planctomycetes bacterium]|nr:heavy metal translocating P-type ATPase [Planctomycetota bacterium]
MLERRLDVNFLMILAALVSAALGHWGEGAVLLFLFSLSDAMERFAIERTRRSIRSVMALRPPTALLIRDGAENETAVEQLRLGDEIRVRPGMRFPIDGLIVDGRAAIDESVVTGESIPVDKGPGDAVFAGTINADGSLRVRMNKPAAESTIARIVHMVETAQDEKIAVQRTIERWQAPYVYGVLAISALTILAGGLFTSDWAGSLQRGMVLLVAASPCAVVLASPVAVLSAITCGARHGVLFKGGAHLERLAEVDTVAFDKTGTVTLGRLQVVGMRPHGGASEDQLLSVAASIEAHSEHPLAVAIVAAAKKRALPMSAVDGFSNVAGDGVSGTVGGCWTGVGRRGLFEKHGVSLPDGLDGEKNPHDGHTTVLVHQAGGVSGTIELRDTLRTDAASAVASLHAQGVENLVLLTGDHTGPARRIASQLGFHDVRAELRPEDKLDAVRGLRSDGKTVAMIGDGVNDAPALAAAHVGLAMGARGTDVAMETADVVLMRDDLHLVADAIHLARSARQVIRQSLVFALVVIGCLVTLTGLGWLRLPTAVVGHEGSTVLVVLNGLRLLRTPLGAAKKSSAIS